MRRTPYFALLAIATVALLCAATAPASAAYEFSVFGSPYWAPQDTDQVAGGGLNFEIPVGSTGNWGGVRQVTV